MSEPTMEAVPPPTFSVQPYRSDGGWSLIGAICLVGMAAMLAVGLGLLGGLIKEWGLLHILAPLVFGFVLGGLLRPVLRLTRIRARWLVGVASLVGGVLVVGIMLHQDYLVLQQDLTALPPHIRTELDRLGANLHLLPEEPPPDVPKPEWSQFRRWIRLNRIKNFIEYVDFVAEEGVSIGSTNPMEGEVWRFGYHETYLYYGLMMLAVAGAAWFVAQSVCKQPFCTGCQRWKESRVVGFHAGSPEDTSRHISGLWRGELRPVPRFSIEADEDIMLAVEAAVCPQCQGSGPVEVSLQAYNVPDRVAQQIKQFYVTFPGAALPVMEAHYKAPEALVTVEEKPAEAGDGPMEGKPTSGV